MDSAELVERPQRYSLTRELIGYPQHLTSITSYPIDALPSIAFLEERIKLLQEHYPALYTVLADRKTKHPTWRVGKRPWDVSRILSTLKFENGTTVEDVLKTEMDRFSKADMDTGPYWQVTRHVPKAGSGEGYITLSHSHTLMDGRAMLHLSSALLATDPPNTHEPAISIPIDVKEYSPGLGIMIPLVWKNLVVPRLPFALQYILPQPILNWPEGDPEVSGSPSDYEADISYLAIPASLSDLVKSASKERKASFHVALKVAFLVAMWKVLRPNGEPLHLSGNTPRDDRCLPNQSQMSGCYTSSSTMSTTFTSETVFWDLVSSWTTKLRDPAMATHGKQTLGVLAYIPDPDGFTSTDPRRCTGWEDFWLNKLEGKGSMPVDDSYQLSNLTGTSLPPRSTDFAWVQPASPLSTAIRAAMVGHEGGLRVVTVWREGYCVTRKQIKSMEEVFLELLTRASEGEGDRADELTA